jgi:peptidoglycan-associated lipoprotein
MPHVHRHGVRMLTVRSLALAFAAVLVSACAANPKSPKSSTDVVDAAPAPAPAAVAAAPAEPAPPAFDTAPPTQESCALVRVAFAFDSAQLDAEAMRHLRENAECLTRRGATALLIEGHCDERGTTEYNVVLGARRADAVKRYLVALGVGAKIDSVSFGKELPIAQGTGDAVWAQNRRAEMRLPGEKGSDGRMVAGR